MGEEYVVVHHPAGGPLRDLGRRHLRGDLGRHAAHQYRLPGGRLACWPPFVGTTGASMLLIRPLLQTNRERTRVKHTVVFFIFTRLEHRGHAHAARRSAAVPRLSPGRPVRLDLSAVAALALDDRALLLDLLRLGLGAVRARAGSRRSAGTGAELEPLRLRGAANVVWLAGVVLAVAFLRAPAPEVAIAAWPGSRSGRTPPTSAAPTASRPTRSSRSPCCSSGSS